MVNSYNGHLILGDINSFSFMYSAEKEFRIADLTQDIHRKRNEVGLKHGTPQDAVLEIKFNIVPDAKNMTYDQVLKPFYERLKSNEQYSYTVLYNRVISFNDETQRNNISTYDNGFVAKGYITALEEEYTEGEQAQQESLDRILMTIKIRLTQICYLGDNSQNNKTARILA